ncbi:hypothetical protein WJX81_006641 [Elliptochloris bilobata]|uniref:EamA domain-containing protein n=1 Tax=Elliptochloris bilobata TaxID=381761 RepID=A0AAW1RFY7_9CHLO
MGAGSAPHVVHPAASVSRKSHLFGQALMLYAAVVSASTPVAMRYLYRTEQPPVPAVLAAVQTGLAAAILCVLCGSWYLLSALRGRGAGPKAAPRAPCRTLSDAVALQRDDSASSVKLHEAWDGAPAKSGLAALAGTSETRSDSVSLLERGGSTFSVESGDVVPERRRSFQGPLAELPDAGGGAGPAAGVRRALLSCLEAVRRPLARGLNMSARNVYIAGAELGGWAFTANAIMAIFIYLRSMSARNVYIAGAELGGWAFTANAIMVYGLQLTTIAKGAFLIRASIIFTPILSTIAGEAVPRGLWAGALLGFAGSILISVDPVKGDAKGGDPASGAAIGGDMILIASASLWSMVMVRQSKHAPYFSPVTLATVKLIVMALCSATWLAVTIAVFVGNNRRPTAVWEGYRDPIAWLVLLWPALGPFSTGEIAQLAAQARISATAGQVILAIDPLFSILLGLAVDRSETKLGPLGWTGGGILIGACLLASRYARPH